MSDEQTPQPVPQPVQQPVRQPDQPPVAGPAYAPAPQPRNRGRLLLAGGAVGVALVAGAGGFALGHATADDGRDGIHRFGGPGFRPGNGPQQQQPPPGFQGPQDGQDGLPDSRDGDRDDAEPESFGGPVT